METIINLLENNLLLGLILFLIIIPLYSKLGLLDWIMGKKNGNGTSQESLNQNFRNDIKELFSHSDIANKEMGDVNTKLAVIDTRLNGISEDIREIKEELKKR